MIAKITNGKIRKCKNQLWKYYQSSTKRSISVNLSWLLLVFLFFILPMNTNLYGKKFISLKKNKIKIVFSDQEPGPLKMALKALTKDFIKVMKTKPIIVNEMGRNKSQPEIVIINLASGALEISKNKIKKLDGFESHRIYTIPKENRIYLVGNDLRGTIFAIYTFSEKFLGVPPLHYWSSWVPVRKKVINIPADTDFFFKSPQVRYRSLLPGDQDFFMPWKKISDENNNVWLETSLRLKLNTVEAYSTIKPGYKLSKYANLINKYGMVLTSHHIAALNTSFSTWRDYWKKTRRMDPPEYLLSNKKAILDFFRYNATTVQKSGIENLWTIAFRGEKDQPFWSIFKDAPKGDKERAEIINKMHQIQLDMIKEVTKDPDPYTRITFYDEIADLMAKGFIKPPEGKNMIWTYVAARRDPYPYKDIVNFSSSKPVKLGYYMNFNFASTGAHVAPAEGPWKMEFNYRYVNSKSPLYFSVVNVGNFREFVLELSAHAKLLWDYKSYDSDRFLLDYCKQYFGKKNAKAIAKLYKEYYNCYWEPKKSEFKGMDRQFLFQDLRYARVFSQVHKKFYSSSSTLNLNPLHKIGYESTKGRTFRIDLKYNKAKNQVDAILNGMQKTIPKFEAVAKKCSDMLQKLDKEKQTFFNDNLRIFCYYMTHLSKTLYHYMYAYKHQANKDLLIKNLDLAYDEAVRAQEYLFEAQHGIFSTWYSGAAPLKRTFQIDALKKNIISLKQR